ncbi:MAG: tripartite tricarboxylate transporter TctB family protein [Bradyrhizobiaceae bacterium]|nr:tripartite tricarboxylate transporter TctB family protein [Bradyrhizobiaceae bacterium]
MRHAINRWEVLAAAALTLFGIFVAWVGSGYELGVSGRPGPGFFPVCVGLATAILGGVIAWLFFRAETPKPDLPLRPFLAVTAGFVAFALITERFGLIPGTIGLVVLSSLGESPLRPVATAALAIVLAVGAALVFVVGLKIPTPILRW